MIRCSDFGNKPQDKALKIEKEMSIEHLAMPWRTWKVHTRTRVRPWRDREVFHFLFCMTDFFLAFFK